MWGLSGSRVSCAPHLQPEGPPGCGLGVPRNTPTPNEVDEGFHPLFPSIVPAFDSLTNCEPGQAVTGRIRTAGEVAEAQGDSPQVAQRLHPKPKDWDHITADVPKAVSYHIRPRRLRGYCGREISLPL